MTDKLSGIKAGDRVRVTFEGFVKRELMSTGMSILMDGATESQTFFHNEATADTFHIERIEMPLKIGDKVNNEFYGAGIVLAVKNSVAFVEWAMGTPSAVHIAHLERVS